MSYAQGTEHYNFPQIVGSDRPTFVDFNEAFRTIDTKLFGLEGDSSTTDGRLDAIEAALPIMDAATQSAQNTADSAKAEADTNAEHITALEVLTGQHTTQIANKLDSVAIAEQYDPNAGTYLVGDIVVYNGQRYRCTTAVAVAEPFDADKWTGEDVETVLDSLKSTVSAKQDRQWNLLANVTGTMGINFDDLASSNELLLVITTPDFHTYTIFLLKTQVTGASVDQFFGAGDYQSELLNTKIQVKSDATNRFIKLNAVYENGVEVTSTSRLVVRGR